jgi:hypothetical protein
MKNLSTFLLPSVVASALALAGCPGGNPSPDGGGDTDVATPPGGNTCATYCAQLATNCTGDNAQYNDTADCMAYCGAAMWPAGTPGEAAGNTLACRIYHGGTPAMTSAAMHCPHAGPSGDGVCGSVNFRQDMAGTYTRVDRMGMPAVSTALVPGPEKNRYNDADPAGDATFAPVFIATLTALHTALDADLRTLNLTPCSMTPLAGGLPECLGQTYAANRTVASLVVPNDTLTLDLSQPAGFPNGRRLEDPVIDVTLAVLLLKLNGGTCGTSGAPCSAATLAMLPLNPSRNDMTNLMQFPYLAPPHAAP